MRDPAIERANKLRDEEKKREKKALQEYLRGKQQLQEQRRAKTKALRELRLAQPPETRNQH